MQLLYLRLSKNENNVIEILSKYFGGNNLVSITYFLFNHYVTISLYVLATFAKQ
jgi:hypothetical protein